MAQEMLDLLVVGGGPGGTAAAFRARELGLRALVIEYDDLMKRIRDYSKDKLILPSFGGGDHMAFPRGGALLSDLCFEPIDKDDMCHAWKGFYRKHDISVRVGVELTGFEQRPDGVYEVQAWDHGGQCDAVFLVRHIVLALGRGVPRRFDIPGNTDGIDFRLSDPQKFVGGPACVLGGGTSAAEAVIAISGAKIAANDPTAVYWSYRGDKMPRVSHALAQVFFEAYVGNGNIRYYPKSEPAAVVVGDDRSEYLAVRVDRRSMADRPPETTHLEFPKNRCLACIGEDIPEALLRSLGIRMAVGGPRNRKRMVVNRFLETEQPNVYMVGDILSQAYFETDDFQADPAGFREVKHRGNIKSALRDGVLVAQVVGQRREGKTEIDFRVEDAEQVEAPPEKERSQVMVAMSQPVERAEPTEGSPEDAVGFLVRLLPGGVEEEELPLAPHSVTTIGREGCDLNFAADTQLAPRHASISCSDDGVFLRDDGSSTGLFLRVPAIRKRRVVAGDLLRAGRQFLIFGGRPGAFGVIHYNAEGEEVGRYPLGERTIVLGRQAPDITLDANDGTLSRRQLAIAVKGEDIFVKDLKSANGTYLQVKSATRLEDGDRFKVGQQTFAFGHKRDAVLDAGYDVGAAAAAPVAAASPSIPAPALAAAAKGPAVTFRGHGKPLPVAAGQTICEVAEAQGVKISAECHAGICGSDPIRILSGLENLEGEASEVEAETLEDICGLKAGECRLACMVRLKGSVEVEIL
jgi:thioredoxin reductase/pSer/pThr/pTyr-binding forkhead associated (FHA) protein/ferredoxin